MNNQDVGDNEQRNYKWAEAAIEKELEILSGLPIDTNIRKPNNLLWASIYRLAGVVNGSQHHNSQIILNSIKFSSRHLAYTPRQMDYQWKRAIDRAQPRQRSQ